MPVALDCDLRRQSHEPTEQDSYRQDRAILDVLAVMNAAAADKAFIAGNSMGGFSALHFALRHSDRTLGSVVAGCGYDAPSRPGSRVPEGVREDRGGVRPGRLAGWPVALRHAERPI